MAKAAMAYLCTACGAVHKKWAGQCSACGTWNAIEAEAPAPPVPGARGQASRGRTIALVPLAGHEAPPARSFSGLGELDRVLGGGLVPGSAVLLGGDPGIGKSTLLLQAIARFAEAGLGAVYVSGEEALAQVRLRAARLGLSDAPVRLAAETRLSDILATLDAEHRRAPLGLVVIDSIQTMWSDAIDAAPGSVGQVRGAAHELTAFAKRRGPAVVLVGHVTKDGQIAGPRVVEHMVDTVLYFEGERAHQFRLLRAVKNRYGPAGEIGVFEMTAGGLAEVSNPSALFLGEQGSGEPTPGAAVFAGIEGTRPVLVEVQALVARSALGTPRRAVIGWDSARLAMVLAVLEARCGVSFAGHDVYLNLAGGLRISEPAADLAAALALVSALTGQALPARTAIFGEISLSGALRGVAQEAQRLGEAEKLGFTAAIAPSGVKRADESGISVRRVADLPHLLVQLFGELPA